MAKKYVFKKAPDYISDPTAVETQGWVKVDDWWFSIAPLWDPDEELWAKLTYRGALLAASRWGGEIANFGDIDRLHADVAKGLAFELPVFSLPDQGLLSAAHLPSNREDSDKDKEAERDAFRDANMGGGPWAHHHDDDLVKPALKGKWDPKSGKRLANCGKHWISGPLAGKPVPTGKAMLKGWWNGKKFIQEGTKVTHNDLHHDYATTTIIKVQSDKEPSKKAPKQPPK
jgi:hypothetical protein